MHIHVYISIHIYEKLLYPSGSGFGCRVEGADHWRTSLATSVSRPATRPVCSLYSSTCHRAE